MPVLQKKLRRFLARWLSRWAETLNQQLETEGAPEQSSSREARAGALPHQLLHRDAEKAGESGPPEHWLRRASAPPEHWLEYVRQARPKSLTTGIESYSAP